MKEDNKTAEGAVLPIVEGSESEGLRFKTEVYEGPLDLLLALITKNKVDICDIPIALILDQYLAYLDLMRRMDVEIASEFIVMAAELMLIKSKMLLPRREEEEENPRERLAAALLEYKRAKEASPLLLKRYGQFSGRLIKEEMELAPEKAELEDLDVELLEKAFERILRHAKLTKTVPEQTFKPLITRKVVPVNEKMSDITHLLQMGGRMSFREIIQLAHSRSEAIASFLALLEMIKTRVVNLFVEEDEEIVFELNAERDEREPLISDFDSGEGESQETKQE